MASTSMEMSASATSRKETAHKDLDESIAILRDKAKPFARLSPTARADLLRACIPRLAAVTSRWVEAALKAKGLPAGTPPSSEELLAGPLPTIRNARLLARSLDAIATDGKPALPRGVRESHDGRALVPVFPGDGLDSALFAGFTCDVRMLPEVSSNGSGVRDRQASFYAKKDPEGAVSLVLGAGNVSSIPPMDAFYKMFVDGSVCLLKMNPVNEYLGPFYEEALEPLVRAGYLRIAYGAGEVGSYLTSHAGIDDIHITGSDRTHDLIVWGPPGPARDRRKAAKDPLLKKTITSELGCVTPVILVPGHFSERELDFLAQNLASMVVNNASCNCNAAKMLITSSAWPQRQALLDKLRAVLEGVPPRKAYYPGAFDRYDHLVGGRGDKLGKAGIDELPWALMFGLDSRDKDERLFATEPFCPIVSETTLDEREPAAFLKAATAFANDRLWGTLSAVVIIHPKTERDPEVKRALDTSIADLRYGAVGVNHWSALVYATVTPPWGAHPSSTLENIQGGLGWVHNTFMLEGIEKAVMRGPITVTPKPAWFVTHKKSHLVAEKMVDMEAAPSWLKVPGIALTALSG